MTVRSQKSNVCMNFQSYTLESFSLLIRQTFVHFRKCLKRISLYTHTLTHTNFASLTYPYNSPILSLQTIQITQSTHSRIIAVSVLSRLVQSVFLNDI